MLPAQVAWLKVSPPEDLGYSGKNEHPTTLVSLAAAHARSLLRCLGSSSLP